MMLIPNDIASDNVSPHVVGTKGPVVHLAHLVEILNSNDFPKHGNYDHHKMIALKDESYEASDSNDLPTDERNTYEELYKKN